MDGDDFWALFACVLYLWKIYQLQGIKQLSPRQTPYICIISIRLERWQKRREEFPQLVLFHWIFVKSKWINQVQYFAGTGFSQYCTTVGAHAVILNSERRTSLQILLVNGTGEGRSVYIQITCKGPWAKSLIFLHTNWQIRQETETAV